MKRDTPQTWANMVKDQMMGFGFRAIYLHPVECWHACRHLLCSGAPAKLQYVFEPLKEKCDLNKHAVEPWGGGHVI